MLMLNTFKSYLHKFIHLKSIQEITITFQHHIDDLLKKHYKSV